MSSGPVAPVRFGVIGLGRSGTFHLEQLSLRADCRPVAAHDLDPGRAAVAAHFGCRFESDGADLIESPDVDVVLVATTPASHAHWATAALSAGRHVIVEPPICLAGADAELMGEAADRAARGLWVLPDPRGEADFRAAREAVVAGALGQVQAVKHVLWSYGVSPIAAIDSDRPAGLAPAGGALVRDAAPRLAQLLELVDDEPATVFAQFAHATSAGTGTPAETGVLVVVRFARGAVGHVEINLTSVAALETGWLVAGTRGAYHSGRRTTLLPTGELLETPEDAQLPPLDLFGDVVRHVRAGSLPPSLTRRARREALLLEAVRLSALQGRTVEWHDVATQPALPVGAGP